MFDSFPFVPMLLVLIVWWIAASIAVSMAADSQGRDKGSWFLVSFLLGPFFAALILQVYPSRRTLDGDIDKDQGLSLTRY